MTTKKQKQFDALKWVSQAAAREDNRPVLTWAHYDANTSSLACADGYRLFVARGVESPANLIDGQYLQLKKSVRNEQYEIGKFPDYNAIIPSGFNLSAFRVDVQHFTQAVKLAEVFSRDNNHSVRLDFYPESRQLRVSGRSNERGDCETVIQIVPDGSSTFERLSVALNGTYLLDALTGFDETVLIQVKDHQSPCIIGDLNAHFALLMPMSVSTERFGAKVETPQAPAIEPYAIGYRSPALKDNRAAIRKRNKESRERSLGVNVGPNICHQLAGSPEAALRNDIHNALNLSAASNHGMPEVEYGEESNGNRWFAVRIANGTTRVFEQFHDHRPDSTVGIWGDVYEGVALSRALVYRIALEWHWERLVNRALQLPAMQHTRKDIRGQFTHYRPNTGILSAFRKRARLLSEGASLASVYFGAVNPRVTTVLRSIG